LFIDQFTVVGRWYAFLERIFGPELALMVRDSISIVAQSRDNRSTLLSLISFLAIYYSASALFFQLEYALNKVFNVPVRREAYKKMMLRNRLLSFLIVIGLSLVLTFATLVSMALSQLAASLKGSLGIESTGLLLRSLVSLAAISLLIAVVYKTIPDIRLAWRDTWLGAFVAAFLIMIAGSLAAPLISIGKGGTTVASLGSFSILLITIYIFAQIFLLGAVVTRVYASLYGSRKPVKQASLHVPA
jgi:membrane protein